MIAWLIIGGILAFIGGAAYLGSKCDETSGKAGDSTGAGSTGGGE